MSTMPNMSRRGGKPKGFTHTGAQRQLPGHEASAVQQEFLQVLNDALPYAAWVELRACTPDEVTAWADRWWVNAPCVREQASAIVALVARRSDADIALLGEDITLWKSCACPGSLCRHHYTYAFRLRDCEYEGPTGRSNYASALTAARAEYQRIERNLGDPPPKWRSPFEQFTDSYRGPDLPSAWRKKLGELNRLPIDTAWLDDVLNSPLEPIADGPEEQFRDRAERLASCGPTGQKIAEGLIATLQRHGGSVAGAAPQLRQCVKRLRGLLAKRHRQGRLDPDTLGWFTTLSVIVSDVEKIQQVATEARASALRHPRVLAPLGADPARESRKQFLRRAANHWNARATDVDNHRAADRPDHNRAPRQILAVDAHPLARSLPG